MHETVVIPQFDISVTFAAVFSSQELSVLRLFFFFPAVMLLSTTERDKKK